MTAAALPRPRVTPDTEFFWRGGEHGELRFERCVECKRLLHPSQAVCPRCRRSELEVTAVSGRAVVVGFTVNYHAWRPGLELPYVVAVVAIEEEPSLRLTTNIVNSDPDDVHIGMTVTVTFEPRGDVWLPVFEPVPAGTAATYIDIAVEPPVTSRRRHANVEDGKFEDRVAITGIGMSETGRRLMRAPVSLAVEACLAAVEDAGLQLSDIDGLSTYPGAMEIGGLSEGGIAAVEEGLGLQPTWHNGAFETPGHTGSVVAAMLAVASGLCRHVLCFRTVWESTHAEWLSTGRLAPPGDSLIGGDMQWRVPYGAFSAANWIGVNASQYFHQYGGGREMLGWIALNARANAARNPRAIYREPLTMDEYLSARMITTPFGLYDCDVLCDGAIAVVVSVRDAAPDLRQPPVLVEAVGTQITERQSWDQGTLTHEPNVFGSAAHLWTRTSLRPADVDVAELYDGFTFNCVSWLEGLGFCGVGEAPDFLDGGHRIGLAGELPLNTHGGQLSAGRLHGYGFLHEAVLQLRGQAEGRQVADAEVAVVSTGGGTPGGCLLLTTAR